MTKYAPLNIKPETKDRLMQHKDHPKDTQDDVVNQVLDAVEGKDTPETDGVEVGDLQDRLDRIEEAAKEATNAAQSAEAKIEGLTK